MKNFEQLSESSQKVIKLFREKFWNDLNEFSKYDPYTKSCVISNVVASFTSFNRFSHDQNFMAGSSVIITWLWQKSQCHDVFNEINDIFQFLKSKNFYYNAK